MAQSTILAPGLTAATSTDIVLAAGESCAVGAYSTVLYETPSAPLHVFMDTPGADNLIATLTAGSMQVQLQGPGTFRVQRFVLTGTPFGVFKES